MCGRFTQMMTWKDLCELLRAEPDGDPSVMALRYNIAPTQTIAAVTPSSGSFRVDGATWGVHPEWAKSTLINAQAEKYLAGGRSFWAKFQRCAVAASGFYEWKRVAGGKQPTYLQLRDGKPFLFEGLAARQSAGKAGEVVVVTTRPNDLVGQVHNRMPAILQPEHIALWLDLDTRPDALRETLQPYPAERMELWPVSGRVNSPAHDDPGLVEPV